MKFRKKVLLIVIFLLMLQSDCFAKGQCVILLHGLGRTERSMSSLADYLKNHGYIVINQSYPSTKKSIKELANDSLPPMIDACLSYHPDNVYIVSHSLGGIVVRQYLQNHSIPKLTRIVMLGPPNHGSNVADSLHNNFLFRFITGPAGQELLTDKNSTPNRLPDHLSYPVGIIAGNRSLTPFWRLFFNESNDGEVSVASTELNQMQDFIVLPVSHTFLVSKTIVMRQVLNFLDNGKFIHTENLRQD